MGESHHDADGAIDLALGFLAYSGLQYDAPTIGHFAIDDSESNFGRFWASHIISRARLWRLLTPVANVMTWGGNQTATSRLPFWFNLDFAYQRGSERRPGPPREPCGFGRASLTVRLRPPY